MKISTFYTFKKEQFPQKLFAEIRYLNRIEDFTNAPNYNLIL